MTNPIEIAARALCTESNHAIFDATDHRGDCTGECFTCPLCEANDYREMARAILEHFRAAGFALVPVEATEEMIEAGTLVEERVASDLENYVSGVTPDWDTGMKVNAVTEAAIKAGDVLREGGK